MEQSSEPTADPRVVEACLRVEAALAELARVITGDLREREPAYAPLPLDDLTEAVVANVAGLIESVRLNEVKSLAGPRRTGRARAEQSIPLPTVLSGYRLGVMHVWRELVAACAAVDAETDDLTGGASRALLGSASVLWTAYDIHAQELAAEYRAVEAETLERDRARQDALLAAVFGGDPVGGLSLSDIAQRLRIPRSGPFVVVMTDPGLMASRRITGRGVAPLLGAPCAWRTGADTDVGLVAPPQPGGVDPLLRRLTALQLGRVGVSRPVGTLHEVPTAVDQARQARTAGPDGPEVLTVFDDVLVGSLVMSAPERASGIEQTVLGGLQHLSLDEQGVLLGTLAAWFAHGGAPEGAARKLQCHPNTVRYRLTRLTKLTGRSLKDPLDLVHLHLAAEARRLRTRT